MDAQAAAKIPCAHPGAQLKADGRLQQRYDVLVSSHLSDSQRVAAGIKAPASVAKAFAATQAAWRFFSNDGLSLGQLAGPLLACAREEAPALCQSHVLVVMDWCNLHLKEHERKADRVELAQSKDLGYELLTALAISDSGGQPIAPVCLELRASDGVHSTRQEKVMESPSVLDGLEPVMQHVQQLELGKPAVFIIDREADSLGHYRQWDKQERRFLVRANDKRKVLYDGQERSLGEVGKRLTSENAFVQVGPVLYKGREARQYVAETMVVLHRAAYTRRKNQKTGKLQTRKFPGGPLPLRLVVSEVRNEKGKVLARWLLLSNLPETVESFRVALWYYWRWRIESYHKLLKGAGLQVECWQQECVEAMSRRLLVAAMAGVVVWRLAREEGPEAAELREVLVRLSGRQMKRGKSARPFTEPALLAGLGVFIPMLQLLETYSVQELQELAEAVLPAGLIGSRRAIARGRAKTPGRPRGVV